jgi:type 1 glutamine amidotransferase
MFGSARILFVLVVALLVQAQAAAADKRIVLIAGRPSHGPGDHEFRAGCLLLQKCLNEVPGITSVVYSNGWPHEANAFEGAAAILIYADGGAGHPAIKPERLKLLGELMSKGVGLGLAHYGVEVPKDKGGPEFLDWVGGYFEAYWSVNPHWDAHFKELPEHPVTRGVKPFKIRDEWYYHMRFPRPMAATCLVSPILTAIPPDSTRGKEGDNKSHGGNPHVLARKGMPEHVMWVAVREHGRGFGFTGGHYHNNWGDENFRKIFLNALLWIAKAEVPANGVECKISAEDLKANLDVKKK